MNAVAIIASARPELADLAKRSLARFAPGVTIARIQTKGLAAREHADAIELVRSLLRGRDTYTPNNDHVDQVILFDDDAVVLSDQWLPTLQGYHDKGYAIVGGLRHRGNVEQVMVDGVLVPHAHCLSFTRTAFDAVRSFHAVPQPGIDFLRYDTTVLAVVEASRAGEHIKVLPFHALTTGPAYPNLPVAEYFDPEGNGYPLWAHLGRGTSFAPASSSREALRRLAAQMGFKRAQKIIRRQKLREQFIEISQRLIA